MVSVNYNMKINTKKTKFLRVSKASESDNEDSSCRENYRTSQGILLLRKHDLRRCHREIKRRIATAASIWFEIWGSWIQVKEISISTGKFPKIFNSFRQFYKRISSLAGKFLKILIFFRQLKKFDFQAKYCPFRDTSGQIILFLFKSNDFRTYFLYIIRCNNISRPVHEPNDPLATLHATHLPKIWGSRPSAPRIDAPG